jgi:hypothetical protein
MRLKIRCPKGRAGSTPGLRTTYHSPFAVYTDDTSFSFFQKSAVGAVTVLLWSSRAGDSTGQRAGTFVVGSAARPSWISRARESAALTSLPARVGLSACLRAG